MPPLRHIGRGRRAGSVLVAALLMGMAAFGMTSLCLSASSAMFKEFAELSGVMGRENAAREAMNAARAYFIADMKQRHSDGEKFSDTTPNPRPITEIPRSVFARAAELYPGSAIGGVIIDLNYSGLFAEEAKRLRVPHGRPSIVTIGGGGGAKTYRARRYELRTTVTPSASSGSEYTMKQGLLLLIGADGGGLEAVDLYTEK